MDKTINSHVKLEMGNSQNVFEVLKQSVPVLIGIYIFFNPFPHTTAIKAKWLRAPSELCERPKQNR